METEIIETLKKDEWAFAKVSDGIYQTNYLGKHNSYLIQINLRNLNSSLLLANSFFNMAVDKRLIFKAAWKLNEINLLISTGSFQIDFDSGQISYRIGTYFFNTPFQMKMITNMLSTLVSYTDQNHLSIDKLISNKWIFFFALSKRS